MKKYSFRLENKEDHFLDKLFYNISNSDYIWFIEYGEVFKQNNDFLFETSLLTNEKFWQTILSDNNYYIVEFHVFLYQNKEQKEKNNLLLELEIIDCEFTDVYFNDKEIEKQMLKNIDKMAEELQK